MGKRWGAKSLKKRIGGVKSHNQKKDRGKSAIKHKHGVQNQKGGKRMGCKIAQKKRGGAKSHNWQKIGEKVQLRLMYVCRWFEQSTLM